ncbi:ribonuclease P protein component [Candidatus Pacebacteria bacterium]|nr:ribonuclease P protein component [Candidatus Paceibacterota bacterium]
MLKKTHRLTSAAFDHYFKAGARFHTPCLQLIYAPHDHFHGAVVVGKKVHQSAVARNRLRRQLYSTLYQHHLTEQTRGVFIVIVKPAAVKESVANVRSYLTTLLSKVT